MKVLVDETCGWWTKMMIAEYVGDSKGRHRHSFSHKTLFSYGKWLVKIGDKTYHIQSPHIFVVPANTDHEVIAEEPGAVATCIYRLDDEVTNA